MIIEKPIFLSRDMIKKNCPVVEYLLSISPLARIDSMYFLVGIKNRWGIQPVIFQLSVNGDLNSIKIKDYQLVVKPCHDEELRKRLLSEAESAVKNNKNEFSEVYWRVVDIIEGKPEGALF